MPLLGADLLILLQRDLRALAREVSAFPDEATLWGTLPGIPNSAGNLALHVAGNLRHFIGAVLGGSGYVRNRDREFLARACSRAEVLAELALAEADVAVGLATLDAAALDRPFPVPVAGVQPPTGRLLLHLAVHLGFHLGQAGYLRRALTGSPAGVQAMGLPELLG